MKICTDKHMHMQVTKEDEAHGAEKRKVYFLSRFYFLVSGTGTLCGRLNVYMCLCGNGDACLCTCMGVCICVCVRLRF